MKHWHWASLAFLAVILAAVVMTVPRLGGGPSGEPAYAHVITATPGVSAFHAELDLDPWNGDAPCDPEAMDTTASVGVGAPHEVAVCITSAPYAVSLIQFELRYDDTLNQCVNEDCTSGTCLDDNPDANVGSTLGSGVPTNPNLGSGWDCTGFIQSQPLCDSDTGTGAGHGAAKLDCGSLNGPFTAPTGDVGFPLAVVTFTTIAGGTVDNLSLASVATYTKSGIDNAPMGSCNPTLLGEPTLLCFGATVDKSGNPPPTNTPTATATATPNCGRAGQPTCTPPRATPKAWTKTPTPEPTGTPEAPTTEPPPAAPPPAPPPTGGQLPQVVPPGTGSGPDGVPWASTAVWLMAAAGAVSISLGGLLLRRAGHR